MADLAVTAREAAVLSSVDESERLSPAVAAVRTRMTASDIAAVIVDLQAKHLIDADMVDEGYALTSAGRDAKNILTGRWSEVIQDPSPVTFTITPGQAPQAPDASLAELQSTVDKLLKSDS